MKRILFVDDEEAILRALNRLFISTDYECHYVADSTQVMAFLENHPIDLLVTDIRMPQLSGIELLKMVKLKHPKIIRVALSGYTDSAQIMNALERGLVKLYLYKPWNNEELKRIIDNVFSLESKLSDTKMITTINSLSTLPTLPTIYQNISLMVEAGESAKSIATVIESDPAIASRILRVANSAYYGSRVGSIQQAITFLGFTNIKTLVLIDTVFHGASGNDDLQLLWKHAALTNNLFMHLHHELLSSPPSPAYTSAGLLHSIGLILMRTSFKRSFETIKDNVHTKHVPWLQSEREIIGLNHTELGAYLLNWWELPQSIVEAACYYQEPSAMSINDTKVVSLVHLASHEAWRQMEFPLFSFEIDSTALEHLKVTPEKIKSALDSFTRQTNPHEEGARP